MVFSAFPLTHEVHIRCLDSVRPLLPLNFFVVLYYLALFINFLRALNYTQQGFRFVVALIIRKNCFPDQVASDTLIQADNLTFELPPLELLVYAWLGVLFLECASSPSWIP